MKKHIWVLFVLPALLIFSACGKKTDSVVAEAAPAETTAAAEAAVETQAPAEQAESAIDDSLSGKRKRVK